MNDIRVRARIFLLPTLQSGRTAPVFGSYRPNHNFGAQDNPEMAVAFIEFGDGESLRPGQTTERELTFWDRPGLVDWLTPGREWRIQEGARLVGVGTVIQVLRESA